MNDYEGNPIMDVFDDPAYREQILRDASEEILYEGIEDTLPDELNDF